MHDKLKLLLDQISMNKDCYTYFSNGTLDKISVNKQNESAKFLITLDKILPLDVYDLFHELLARKYNTYYVDSLFNIRNIDYSDVLSYIIYFMQVNYSDDYEETYKELDIEIVNDVIKINGINDSLNEEFKDFISEQLINAGYNDIKIITSEKNKDKNKIKQELEKINYVKKKEEERKKEINKILIKGREVYGTPKKISDIITEEDNVIIEFKIFGTETRETQTTNIITLKVTDNTDSIFCKIFENDINEYKNILKSLKNSQWFRARGKVKRNSYSNELELTIYDMLCIDRKDSIITDDSLVKRVELHTHTKMSQMDGVCDEVELVKKAISYGHKAIAITDHNACQAFPHVYNEVTSYNKNNPDNPFKVIYGAEVTMVEDEVVIITRGNDSKLEDNTYVVFDVETTGFNAGLSDSMIEIGAVKIKNGEIIERFDELINPGRPLDISITEITSITDSMLQDKDNEENVTKRFKEFIGDFPLVAHNAKFD